MTQRGVARTGLRAAVTAAVVVTIFAGVLPRIASYSDVWAVILTMSWPEVASMLLIAGWNLVTYWFVQVAALPGLRYRQAAVAGQASTAISNTVPAGGAVGVGVTYAMYRSWGFTPGEIARSVVVSGIWNNFMKLGFPVVALGLLAIEGGVSAALVGAALTGIAVLVASVVFFALLLRSDHLARVIGERAGRIVSRPRRLLGRSPVTTWGDTVVRFRGDTIDLVASRWPVLTLSAFVSHLSLAIVLLTALRLVGSGQDTVSWIAVLAAFAFVRLISALPITPGGVGVVELGYVAALTIGLESPERAGVVAGVLMFRFLTYFLPIPFGLLAYLFWRSNRSWRRIPDPKSGFSGSVPGNTR
ncbi:MAG: lysylphosphatidylglycerol synthase domain-containing protein [Acidimicrobiia bacterium]|nr:lysylphosphatidylglycerol synthase domain-containing protein [Acidimicrobiia bacterium]